MKAKFQFAKELVYEAGQFIRKHLSDRLEIEEKTRFDDLVTNIDRSVQEMMVEKINHHYPCEHIFAEENEMQHDINDKQVWVIDPIDGTVNFIVQKQDFSIMLAYYEDGIGQFGIIYDVMNDKMYSGGGVFDVYENDHLLSPYWDKPLHHQLIGSNSGMFGQNYKGIADLAKETLGVRILGGAGLSFAHVFSGRFMAYFSRICPWDYAAASIMGDKLGYVTLTMDFEKPDFTTRQCIMMVPKTQLDTIAKYIK